ncbi:MAG: tRNA-queuosine alpha-mannosyltransferase domain-containing protein [Planctomycetota bacterium]|jgi:glycosyltransferase involved in cell wall biosynthesis
MNILALESYYGGSHKAFLDGLSQVSRHTWTILGLPAHTWKWRMRHSAITFAGRVRELVEQGQTWDLLFCSDMLNLAEFVALAPLEVAGLPKIIYFHENQLTYPVRLEDERDYQYAMTNLTSALASDVVWFNSAFHRDAFLEAMTEFLKSMPDHQPLEAVERIRAKSAVYPPGIDDINQRSDRDAGPIRILWAARWEHDKNPEDFFAALKILKANSVPFRLSVIGQSFQEQPAIFAEAKREFRDHIDHWGYQSSRADYENVLRQADVAVSTADHEFFGIGILEGVSAGAYPVVPKRLSYPEILGLGNTQSAEQFFYDGTVEDLADTLTALARRIQTEDIWPKQLTARLLTERFEWPRLVDLYDKGLEQLFNSQSDS